MARGDAIREVTIKLKKRHPDEEVPTEIVDQVTEMLTIWTAGVEAQLASKFPGVTVEIDVRTDL